MPRIINFTIDDEFDGKKVIHYLRGKAKLSCRTVNMLKRVENGITLNGKHIRTIDLMKKGDVLTVSIPDEECELEKISAPLDILYEDEDLLIINKSPYMAMHPTHNHQGDTLANAVAAYLNGSGAFRAIGRLDKGTSGIVVCAKNRHCASRLSGNIKKEYFAVVTGRYEGKGTINVPIYRPDPMKTLRACGEQGDEAITHWEAIKSGDSLSLLKIHLETGRTHQIRVHFAHLGTPLAGDTMYGEALGDIKHQLLHCGKVSFVHPVTGVEMSIEALMPDEMEKVCKKNLKNF